MRAWDELISYYQDFDAVGNELKVASLAQWMLESARGTSKLANEHFNFAGLKYRARMRDHAKPVDYRGRDGDLTTYCAFESVGSFVLGYWHFIRTGPYEDWETHRNDGAGYIRHLASRGYAADPDYIEKTLRLFEEAEAALEGAKRGSASLETEALARVAVVVGHNHKARGAASVAPISKYEFDFNKEVAALMKREAREFNLAVELFYRQPEGGYTAEIERAYAAVSAWKADCAIELHFNATEGAHGTEMLHRSDSKAAAALAGHVLEETVRLLKLRDRGLKPKKPGDRGATSLYALDKVPTIIAEPFFGSSKPDCLRMATLGNEALALAYLRGLRDWAVSVGLTTGEAVAGAEPRRPAFRELAPAELDARDV
jgi:N-acetylmuramoyl-L-alanine amidase